MKIIVEIWANVNAMAIATIRLDTAGGGILEECDGFIAMYRVDHDSAAERRVLGEQCRNAFEAGQCVLTYTEKVEQTDER